MNIEKHCNDKWQRWRSRQSQFCTDADYKPVRINFSHFRRKADWWHPHLDSSNNKNRSFFGIRWSKTISVKFAKKCQNKKKHRHRRSKKGTQDKTRQSRRTEVKCAYKQCTAQFHLQAQLYTVYRNWSIANLMRLVAGLFGFQLFKSSGCAWSP